MTVAEPRFELIIPPQPQQGRAVRHRVVAFAKEHGVDGDDLVDFLTALGEALANAFEHSSSETISVEVRLSTTRITAIIRDAGVGFMSDISTFSLPEATSERGRGLPIMRHCCDVFDVISEPGQGTAVIVGCALPARIGKARAS